MIRVEPIDGRNWRAAVAAFGNDALSLMARAYVFGEPAPQLVYDGDEVVGLRRLDNMEYPTDVVDSTEPWVKKQIDEYVATDGAAPKFPGGAPLVLLTYQGRKTGQWRRTCLIGAAYGDVYLLVASYGGADKHPAWYPNLVENPSAWLQVGPDVIPVVASTATPEEKPALYEFMTALYAGYAEYQQKTSRDIPVVILTPVR